MNFPLVGKQIPLVVLAARLGPLGHGPGFGGGFRGWVKPCYFLLMKNGGVRSTPPPTATFFLQGFNGIVLSMVNDVFIYSEAPMVYMCL